MKTNGFKYIFASNFFYDQREMMVDDSLKRIMRVAWGGRKEEELRYII